ncbi:hypothetical protein IAQ61_011217 [Plenodomus lingam]|uniref:Predicted protein n=1 Tax=Leptosphaeria maculans (strain JN3 / isolate v23.1.3 / race Av1-4-5-6-7-8) TaxID=985895 RepID=E5A9E5_LEPMJ|nr:predicted protein [Plenodomus lingam JN3]KAH9859436.1 hypothetical protein IAQ61_011217 [Plenodomus lingam]CBY00286.1 predicted protein [Plenodomus lingam JN3]
MTDLEVHPYPHRPLSGKHDPGLWSPTWSRNWIDTKILTIRRCSFKVPKFGRRNCRFRGWMSDPNRKGMQNANG